MHPAVALAAAVPITPAGFFVAPAATEVCAPDVPVLPGTLRVSTCTARYREARIGCTSLHATAVGLEQQLRGAQVEAEVRGADDGARGARRSAVRLC